jgi:hypothetical protein
MAMMSGSISGTWPAISGNGLASEIWAILKPGIAPDINSILLPSGAPDMVGQNDAAQKFVLLVNAIAAATVTHVAVNCEISGADLTVTGSLPHVS